jgi:WD40 repeat protein
VKWRFTDAVQWDKGSIKGLGWSEDEKLLVVTDDGTVRCYYDLQGDFAPFTLGHVYTPTLVKACPRMTDGCRTLISTALSPAASTTRASSPCSATTT